MQNTQKKLHAVLSPSSASRWLRCHAAPRMEKDYSEASSSFAEEGTFAHAVAADCLINARSAYEWVDRAFEYDDHGEKKKGFVTEEMAEQVDGYVAFVKSMEKDQALFVEVKLLLEPITGEADAEGTADVLILGAKGTLTIIDLKYGKGVPVNAEENEQLMLYAVAAMREFAWYRDFHTFTLAIYQPRIRNMSVWSVSKSDLIAFETMVTVASRVAMEVYNSDDEKLIEANLTPGEKQCRFCKARGPSCPAMTKAAYALAVEDFDDLTAPAGQVERAVEALEDANNERLATAMAAVPFLEMFCKAARAKLEKELFSGNAVRGWKLVEGKRGSRIWTDEEHVADNMAAFGYEKGDIYDISVISPPAAEKKFAKKCPELWEQLRPFITQKEGKPSVAPESDKRPALAVGKIEDDFKNLDEEDE